MGTDDHSTSNSSVASGRDSNIGGDFVAGNKHTQQFYFSASLKSAYEGIRDDFELFVRQEMDLRERKLIRQRILDKWRRLPSLEKAELLQYVLRLNDDVQEFPLNGLNLDEVVLTHANLSRADFTEVSLRGARLDYATLSWASLVGSDLTEADLGHANLQDADLSRAKLVNTNMKGTNLERANLLETELFYAHLDMSTNLDYTLLPIEKAGQVVAGAAGEDFVERTKGELEPFRLYSFEIVGKSMVKEGMFPGEHIIVQPQPIDAMLPNYGDLVIARYRMRNTRQFNTTLKYYLGETNNGLFRLGWMSGNESAVTGETVNPYLIEAKEIAVFFRVIAKYRPRRPRLIE